MNPVEVRDAYKYYGTQMNPIVVLNKLNMTISPNSIYALLGASGCGKTCLLSCIIGMIPLDSGEAIVLGHKTQPDEVIEAGPRIGYMPQETALIGELTIQETMYYFGNIFQMKRDKLKERYKMLQDLLELPDSDRRIEECSGGEARRVSFAAAMIHEPELLILDEPTVGLDPMLREKIWEFLTHVTKTSSLAVIITTHYIQEAMQADRVGLMRNGILLAEDTPKNIIDQHHVANLEDAFLKLCMNIGVCEDTRHVDTNEISHDEIFALPKTITSNASPTLEREEIQTLPKHKLFRKQIIKSLLTKNIIQFIRQPAALIFVSVFPILQMLFFYYAIGGNPKGLKLAIVDREIQSSAECFNSSLITTYLHEDTCDLQKISCRFLDEIDDSIATKTFYYSHEEAYVDVHQGKLIGIIEFSHNFTESLSERLNPTEDLNILEYGDINVYLDQTDQQLTFFIQRKLHDVYKQFMEKLLIDCNLPYNLGNIPVNFLKPIYGTFQSEFKKSMAPGMIMIMMFFVSACLSVGAFIIDRKEGFWNKSLLAGVSTLEILLSHVIIHIVFVLVQVVEYLILIALIYQESNHGNYFMLAILLSLLGLSGLFFGLMLSCICTEYKHAILVMFGISQPMTVLIGMLWPLEGMPTFLRYFAYTMPFTLPSISLKNVIIKEYSVVHSSVITGYCVATIWTVSEIYLCIKILKTKKYSRNS